MTKPPRLAIVLPHLRAGGIEKSATLLANTLVQIGWSVRFVLGKTDGPFLDQLAPQVTVTDLGGRRAMRAVPALRRALSRDVDIVYSGTNAWNLSTVIATRGLRSRPKVFISEHTTPVEYLAKAKHAMLRRALMRRCYPVADGLISPTADLAQGWLDALGLAGPRPIYCPNPVLDAATLDLVDQIAAGQGPARDPNLVIAVGRLHQAKGFDLGIRAFAKAQQRRPELRLVIYGTGAEHGALTALIADLGLGHAVKLPGFSDQIGAEMARSGLVLVPSRREGFGNVVVEALGTGTPVLASDCEGPARLLAQTPGAGRIVPQGDIDAMAQAMCDMTGAAPYLSAARQLGPELARQFSAQSTAQNFAAEVLA